MLVLKKLVYTNAQPVSLSNMSFYTNDELLHESKGVSSCCSAKVYTEILTCSDCKEHCEIVDEDDEAKNLRLAVMDRG